MSKELTEEIKQEETEEISEKNEKQEDIKIESINNDVNEEEKVELKNNNRPKIKRIILTVVIIVFLLLLMSLSVAFGALYYSNTKIVSGVIINGIDVSNCTKVEAITKLNDSINKEDIKNIKLKYKDYELELVPEQIETEYDIDEAVNNAYNIGRNSNIFANNFNIIKSMILKSNINLPISVNEEKLSEIVNNIQANIPGAVEESTYTIEGENLIITRGKRGLKVNYEDLKNLILEKEKNITRTNQEEIQIPVSEAEPQDIDIEKIYNEIHTEAKDAYYVEEPFEVFPHVLGVDFNISIEEAKQLISEVKDQYTIPLKITTPEITTDKLGTKAFPNLLGRYTTYYASSSSNRKYNIARAAGSINGKTLMPGEVFSYNRTIGNPSQANGYRLATGFANGKHVDSYGGGVCQVSSTLYNAVVYANLDIVSRANHSLPVAYVPASRDATVYYGGVDFKFKNNRKYPIKIVATTNGSALTVDIYGVKEENEYEVTIESWITERIAYSTKYIDNPNLPQGTEKVISKGSNGYRSVAYKILKQNGVVISKTLLSSDTYNPENREIERGTEGYKTPAVTEVVPQITPSQPQENNSYNDTGENNQDSQSEENPGESNTGGNNNENEDGSGSSNDSVPETVINI